MAIYDVEYYGPDLHEPHEHSPHVFLDYECTDVDCNERHAYVFGVDDLPELAADIHRTVLALVVHGAPCADVDAAIIDRLRGTTPRAADDVHP